MEKPLHVCKTHGHKLLTITNRFHVIVHAVAIAFLVYYRTSFLFQSQHKTRPIPLLPWLLVFASELLLSFTWLLGQTYRWRPVSRTVFPENLPEDDKLPAVDVFICTADPEKEPTVDVMNTVLSAMALDYPVEKLHVYLSDDGGAAVTLHGMREAMKFGRWWVPFCRRYGVSTRCPGAYFSLALGDHDHSSWNTDPQFQTEREKIKEKYERFKDSVLSYVETGWRGESDKRNHPTVVEVINESCDDVGQEDQVQMPLLVYVSREKKSFRHHHFKAGALNVLIRVSGVLSNSPYILVLDCDMYCNDPSSAKQAMCFHLDPTLSPSLAVVQFAQRFHNISVNDIYGSELRYVFQVYCPGMDGLKGPAVCGTNFYIKRKCLYGRPTTQKGVEEMKKIFGQSNEFIKSLKHDQKPRTMTNGEEYPSSLLAQERKVLASCTYEDDTKWGKEVGFWYQSVLEDLFTGFMLHLDGWSSVYLNPSRAPFLGSSTTNLNDLLVQGTRWTSGQTEIAISKFCPFIYGPKTMSFLHRMCYAELVFHPLFYSVSLWCFATIPQLCLFNGIPLYPEVSNPFFCIFLFTFASAMAKNLYESLITGGSVQTVRNEHRIWMIRSVTCHAFGSLDAIMKRFGLREASFLPTNKVVDDEQLKRYQMGIFDFQTLTQLLAPLVTIVMLNMAALAVGLIRIVVAGDLDKMFAQIFLSVYIIAVNYPIIEGMILRKDKGRIRFSVTLLSAILSMLLLSIGSAIIM